MSEDFVKRVDTLATELTVTGEIDTGAVSSPQTVLTPSSGKKIDTRSVYLASDSTSGEVEIRFASSGTLLGKIYCSKFALITLDAVHLTGATDEAVEIAWSDLDTGAKIFYSIRYKEVA